jgi:Cu(I)/Ag(I) efflux system membrane fusion protein
MEGMQMNSDSMQSNSNQIPNNIEVPSDRKKIISSVSAIHPVKKIMQQKINAEGTIAYDTRQERNIASRYSGRIEKLYVKYMYQPVKQGEVLMEIYSPEMVTEQQNLIFLLSDPLPDQQMVSASGKKLLLLGMTEKQIDEVMKTKQPLMRIPVTVRMKDTFMKQQP